MRLTGIYGEKIVEVLYRKHPGTGLMVGTDGSVQLPANKIRNVKTTFGYRDPLGYMYVWYKYKQYRVHRLVAETFIPNPENKREVDHIDRNPSNNALENLRWATRTENQRNRAVVEKLTAAGLTHRWEDLNKFRVEHNKIYRLRTGRKRLTFSNGERHQLWPNEYESLRQLKRRDRNWDDVLANRHKKVV